MDQLGVIIGEQCGPQVDKFKVIIEGHLASNQNDEQAGEEWRPDEETTVTELVVRLLSVN